MSTESQWIYQSIRNGDVTSIKRLMDQGVDMNLRFRIEDHKDPEMLQETPLMTATRYKQEEIVKLLVEKGVCINDANVGTGMTALHQACAKRNYQIASLLIQNGADVNYCDYIYETPILEAINSKDLMMVKLLLYNNSEFSRPVNSALDNGALFALALRQFDIVRFLIAAGTDVNYKNSFGEDMLTVLQDTSRDLKYLLMMYTFLLEAGCKVKWQHLNKIRLKHIRKSLMDAFSQPLHLQQLCRQSIRNYLCRLTNGLCIIEKIYQLPLPCALQGYLSYDIPLECDKYKILKNSSR